MWLAPYTPGSLHEVEITVDDTHQSSARNICGFRVWNYNKYSKYGDDVLKGIRLIKVYVNQTCIGLWVSV